MVYILILFLPQNLVVHLVVDFHLLVAFLIPVIQVDGNPPPDEPPDVVEGKVSGYRPLVMIQLPGTPLVG